MYIAKTLQFLLCMNSRDYVDAAVTASSHQNPYKYSSSRVITTAQSAALITAAAVSSAGPARRRSRSDRQQSAIGAISDGQQTYDDHWIVRHPPADFYLILFVFTVYCAAFIIITIRLCTRVVSESTQVFNSMSCSAAGSHLLFTIASKLVK